MTDLVPPRRLVRESVPAAVVLGFWTLLTPLAVAPAMGTALRAAGLVMTLSYVVVRGVDIASSKPVSPQSTDPTDLLAENVRALFGAAVWFLAAAVVVVFRLVLRQFMYIVPRPYGEFVYDAVTAVVYVFSWTGVATVVLFAVVVTVGRLRGDVVHAGEPTAEAAAVDS